MWRTIALGRPAWRLAAMPGYVLVLAFLLTGCSGYYAGRADRQVARIVEKGQADSVSREQADTVQPALKEDSLTAAELAKEDVAEPVIPDFAKRRRLSLREALSIATSENREFRRQQEDVYLAALALTGERRKFSPILTGTLSYLFTHATDDTETDGATATLGASQILPTGGDLEVAARSDVLRPREGGSELRTYGSTVSANLVQPFLRGAGYEASHESLTQAKRDVIYRLRDFELFRQQFSIDVITKFYGLVSQRQVVENSRRNYERFKFLTRRSEALFNVGRVSALEKFRARQEELQTKDVLIQRQRVYDAELDDFKILLGLPIDAEIDVIDERPQFVRVEIDPDEAINAALANRLDLKNARERIDDAERRIRVARNGLLPDLDLTATYDIASDRTRRFRDQGLKDPAYTVGAELSLPLDRVNERNAYRRALIELDRQRRDHSLLRDRIKLDVLNTLRDLRAAESSVLIQNTSTELAKRRLRNAQFRFQRGEIDNRDVVEAQDALLRAENSYIRAVMDYEIARLQLKKDIGILFIDENGMWKE